MDMHHDAADPRPTDPGCTTRARRRALLGLLGWGAAGWLPGPAAARTDGADTRNFGRLFRGLPAFADPSPQLTAALLDIGRAGAMMDANDPLSAGPIALITDPGLSAHNPNAALPGGNAGSTFLGQFVDHDITFDAGSRLGVPTAPQSATAARQPALDLDSLYGRGPVVGPLLYEPRDRARFRLESGGLFEDLPRDAAGGALIGDPRNDEHVVLSGLHAAWLRFHNAVVERVRAAGETEPERVYAEARRSVTWHYHWIVLNELLPSFIGRPLVDDILRRGRRVYRADDDGEGVIPVEFQGAAYRFGHSMVRPSYRANLQGDRGRPFFGFIVDPRADGQADPDDLRGGARAARRFVGWQTFFDFGDGEVKPRKAIDTRLSTPLFRLPLGAIAGGAPPVSLAQRNLQRQVTWQLPSGQRCAHAMGLPELRPGDLSELAGYGLGLERSTPLWFYVLKEAALATGGQTLGPVGGRIVGEVLIGLMQSDRDSWLRSQPAWRPTLPSRRGRGEFDMVDMLTLAGVDPRSRGQ